MISDQLIKLLSASCQLSTRQTLNALKLLEEGSTIPFISRYRKEATGGMDEVQLADLIEDFLERRLA